MTLCFCLFGALVFTACGDDEEKDENTIVNSPVLGIWEMVEEQTDSTGWSMKVQEYTFKSDGTFSHVNAYCIDPDKRDLYEEFVVHTGIFSVADNRLTLKHRGMSYSYDPLSSDLPDDGFRPYEQTATFRIETNKLYLTFNADGRTYEEGPFVKK